jgi:mRNA-degrading endonuclease toxin of MazEF toxin-antitoxin module
VTPALPSVPLRGTVWWVPVADGDAPRPFVVVSSDARNRSAFPWVHVVRLTTRSKRPLPTIVELGPDDAPLAGRLMADELELVHREDLAGPAGRISRGTLRRLDVALARVLDLG